MQRQLTSRDAEFIAFTRTLTVAMSAAFLIGNICLEAHAQAPGSATITKDQEQTFKQFQQKALDLEHKGDRKQALETIETAENALKSAPPLCDQVIQLRVRQAELQLQTGLENESFMTVKKLLQEAPSILRNANPDGDLWLELGYLKDLLSKFAQDRDSESAFDLSHQMCRHFKPIHCRPRDTLQPLCESQIRHKDWVALESSAKELFTISDNPVAKMTSLAMLQLSYAKQGKKQDASVAKAQLNKLDPRTAANERVWHRDMAGVQKSILNFDSALSEISSAIALDEKLAPESRTTQLATDTGTKAEIETLSGKYDAAIKDARQADKLWGECNPSIWRSRDSQALAKYHADTLSALEQALRRTHKNAEADEIKARRRQIQYIR